MEGAEVVVKSQLMKIVADLEAIQKRSGDVQQALSNLAKDVGKETKESTKQVETGLDRMKNFGRRVADQLRKDFATLASVGSLTSGLKLSENFAGSVKEAVSLSDTVRRFGGILGVAQSQFVSFQTKMQRGLGEIGASSEAAANALKGLAETPVRGQANLIAYARTAAELASIGGEKGQEGSIAKGAAGIITSRGGNANDLNQLNAVTREILQIRRATGKSVTEITSALSGLYAGTNGAFQSRLKNGGSTTLATASLLGGPQATSFIENFLGKNKFSRLGQDAQGFKNILGSNGTLDTKAIASIMSQAKGRGLGDAQAGLTTMGLSDDEAKGFIRLAEALKQNESVIQGAKNSVVDLNDEYRKTMSLGDSFRANINRIKGIFSPAISAGSQGLTNVLGGTSHSTLGAAGVVGGGALLAAVLTGGGLRGILGAIGGEAKAKAVEAATGEKVQKVEVINFPPGLGVGGAVGAAGGLAKAGGMAATAGRFGLYGIAAGTGVYAGKKLADLYDYGASKNFAHMGDLDKVIQGAFEKVLWKLQGFNPDANALRTEHVVKVDVNKKELKVTQRPGRGSRH